MNPLGPNSLALAALACSLAPLLKPRQTPDEGELAEQMPHIVWRADPDGRVTHYSRRFYAYAGRDDAVCWDLMHPDDRPRIERAWAAAIATGADYVQRVRLRRHCGEYRWHHESATAIRDASGRITHWVGQSIDLHEVTTDQT